MSSFRELGDEFAGDAANEEWDATWEAYASGMSTAPASDAAPLRATLRPSVGRVELRGDVDATLLALLADLLDPEGTPAGAAGDDGLDDDLAAAELVPVASLTVHAADSNDDELRWRLEQDGTSEPADGTGHDALVGAVLAAAVDAEVRTDARHLHLRAAAVELDGLGVAVVGEGPARDAALRSLLAAGASYLTRDHLVLQPGTRAVLGAPTPLPRRVLPGLEGVADGERLVAAGAAVELVERCLVQVVVLVDADPASGAAAAGEISPAHAVCQLLSAVRGPRRASSVPELLASLVAGAACVAVDADQLAALPEVVRALQPLERRRLVVPFAWREETGGVRNRRNRRTPLVAPTTRQLIRFDREAVLLDAPDAAPRVLDPEEADLVEAEAVARSGVRPGPDAFGLPGCPVGAAARTAWDGMSILDGPADVATPGSPDVGVDAAGSRRDTASQLPTGVAAELISRSLVGTDDDQRARIVERHVASRAQTEVATAALLEVLDLAEQALIEPVVVGAVVQVWDGPLPGHFTDVDQLDLLVPAARIDELLSVLEDHGYVTEARTLTGAALGGASERRLRHPAHPGIRLDLHRTLAAGPFGELVDPEEFHRRAVPFRPGGRWALALHPEHRFVHACLRADHRAGATTAELREVVLTAPRDETLQAEAMECSARWGATTSVLAVVRAAGDRVPGLPRWLRDRSGAGPDRGPADRRRTRDRLARRVDRVTGRRPG